MEFLLGLVTGCAPLYPAAYHYILGIEDQLDVMIKI